MFTRISTDTGKEIIINTAQIVVIESCLLKMSNGDIISITNELTKEIINDVMGNEKEANPTAPTHTANLLTEIYQLCGGKGEAKPTTDRKARLKSRMKDFSEEELKTAATNLGSDEFMQGANDNNKRYGTIDYLLRTSANVNKWLEETPKKKKGMF